MSNKPTDCSEFWDVWQEAEKAWQGGDHDAARKLFAQAVQYEIDPNEMLSPAACLLSWARLEATIGNRAAFEELWRRGTENHDGPPMQYEYACTLWNQFKDAPAAMYVINVLEQQLKTEQRQWYRETFEKKIGYLREWWYRQDDWPFKP
jgi:hypothetical protein